MNRALATRHASSRLRLGNDLEIKCMTNERTRSHWTTFTMAVSSPGAGGLPRTLCFTNCQVCMSGELIHQDIYFSPESQTISPNYYYRTEGVERIDLNGAIVAPGFLDLQINGMQGIHFTELKGRQNGNDEHKLLQVAQREVQAGVVGFWATLPTIEESRWKEVSNHTSSSLSSTADNLTLARPVLKGNTRCKCWFQPAQ